MKKLIYLALASLLLAACNNTGSKPGDSSEAVAKNKALAQRFYDDVFNKHDIAYLDTLLSQDYIEHTPDNGYEANLAGLKKSFTDFFAAFPDVQAKVNFITCEGDMVTCHTTVTATNTGPMMGNPPSGKKIKVDGVDIIRIKDGKAVEHWGYFEESKMMRQLGLMPETGGTGDKTTDKTSSEKK